MEKVYQFFTLISLLIYWLLIAGITVRIVTKRRSIGVSFAWMMVIYVIPFAGIVLYFLFGELNLGKKRASRAKDMFGPYGVWCKQLQDYRQYHPESLTDFAQSISQLCQSRLGIPALADNRLELLKTTDEIMQRLIEDINAAQTDIHMEFYIWNPGGLADCVADALIKARKRGVKVKVLLDSAGSRVFFKSSWPVTFRSAGIELVDALSVSPVRMFFRRLDLRLHRKIVVIDNIIGYTGSMNMVDPAYFKVDAGVGQWIDVMVRIHGASVPVLNCIHAWDWEVETSTRSLPAMPQYREQDKTETDVVQVIPSGPGMPEAIIQQVLLQSIYQAKHKIVITTPYFIPSENLMFALISAAQRKVSVHIVIPDKNDSMMVEWASRSFFYELLNAGVNIHRFKGGLLHTKSVVIDENHSLIGTVNLDMRSLWLNFEVTLAVEEYEFTQKLNRLQRRYIDDSTLVDPVKWRKRPLQKKFIEQFFYMFSPLL
ncbi:cardiolipin synthase [Shewanella marina]|uniref:cardiolipin synthase n=1 Tax=Shewanella marina TaxID=487319 RepID=UPI00046FF92D|nr:cardiolipin synthase [Shewanella marina]